MVAAATSCRVEPLRRLRLRLRRGCLGVPSMPDRRDRLRCIHRSRCLVKLATDRRLDGTHLSLSVGFPVGADWLNAQGTVECTLYPLAPLDLYILYTATATAAMR
jgi:hypothetical protein